MTTLLSREPTRDVIDVVGDALALVITIVVLALLWITAPVWLLSRRARRALNWLLDRMLG